MSCDALLVNYNDIDWNTIANVPTTILTNPSGISFGLELTIFLTPINVYKHRTIST